MNNLNIYEKDIKVVLSKNKFDGLKNSSILVVGANGLIGSAIIDVLNYLNTHYSYSIKIIGTVRNKAKILDRFKQYNNLDIIEYDINNKLEYDKKIDYIINGASNANPVKFSTDPVGTLTTNFIGTKNLLDFAVTNKIKRLLYISSGEIYGQALPDISSFDEGYNGKIVYTNSRACYPIGKISAENLCVCYTEQYGIDTVIARPCHTYGPTQTNEDSRVTAQFIRNVLDDKDIVLKSDGKQIRSYCYVLDCVTGILTILDKGLSKEAYNVANNNSIISIKDMASLMATACNRKVVFELPEETLKKGFNPVTRSVLDGTKLEELGWNPCFDFETGIKNTINILKKDN